MRVSIYLDWGRLLGWLVVLEFPTCNGHFEVDESMMGIGQRHLWSSFLSPCLIQGCIYQNQGMPWVPKRSNNRKLQGFIFFRSLKGNNHNSKHVHLNYMAETCRNFGSEVTWSTSQLQLAIALQAPLHMEMWSSKVFRICQRPPFVRTTQNLVFLVVRDMVINWCLMVMNGVQLVINGV